MNKDTNKKSKLIEARYDKKIIFTEHEIQCILRYMQNNSLSDIGINLELKLNTVHFYLTNAIQKLYLSGKAL
ncbi:MAG TPA: LuxR C-terminal-related transcriptional regulator [Gammaproteobacteria bacterium]|nr:LuxR C-terminal-related transcriptional regulator [Gammaproteobacteria bacterium]